MFKGVPTVAICTIVTLQTLSRSIGIDIFLGHRRQMVQQFHQDVSLLLLTSSLSVFLLLLTAGLQIRPPTGWYVRNEDRDLTFPFTCFGQGAKVIWMFGGKNITADSPCVRGRARMVCNNVLYITRFQPDYAGLYTCLDQSTGDTVTVPLGGECVGMLNVT